MGMKRSIVALVGVFLAGCSPAVAPSATTMTDAVSSSVPTPDAIGYRLRPGVSVTKVSIPFPYDGRTFDELITRCGNAIDDARKRAVVDAFSGGKGVAYHFAYDGGNQDERDFVVSAFPNALPYVSVKDFQHDFAPCFAAGDFYPHAISPNWILFVNGCGGGDDGSGRHGCEETKKLIVRSVYPK